MLEKFQKNLTLYKMAFHSKMLLDRYPSLYINTLKFHRRGKESYHDVVNNNTDLVIDGYPRSANSFALAAFRLAQTTDYKVATHVHTSSQIAIACRSDIPTLVLIRPPRDAVVSHKSLSLEVNNGDLHVKNIPLSLYLKAYIQFYTLIYPYRDKFVLGKFEQVTSNFSVVIEEINHKFNTKFAVFDHNAQNVEKIFNSSGFHLSPSKKRNSYKKDVYKELDRFPKLLEKAQQVYDQYL
ncbi:hypothetical protein [Candidatus Uabimicrobium amorphum]|uniref:Sulfotransferase domain-containing protein n=1 Tax=Uabimicrobium amorphum TaxID=2596890 RepID=A0A5S9IPN9_UABAM|nr:hypothetical protein [Candidatus Uabimicrobium amorphum]BBM85316.1 hypothetical protein UABAM_03682 [Candidatus Uabimicrobium amorphum]